MLLRDRDHKLELLGYDPATDAEHHQTILEEMEKALAELVEAN